MAPRADVEARLDAFAEHREALALVHHDRRTTHGELRDAVYRTARALDALGDRAGLDRRAGRRHACRFDRRALRGEPARRGDHPAPTSGLSAAARGRIVDDVEAALALLVVPGHEDEADQVLEHCAPVARIDLHRSRSPTASLPPRPGRKCRAPAPGDVAADRHTGGTTGHPKGITYTFGHHLRMLQAWW